MGTATWARREVPVPVRCVHAGRIGDRLEVEGKRRAAGVRAHVKGIDIEIDHVRKNISKTGIGMDDKSKGRIAVTELKLAGECAAGSAREDGDVAGVFDGVEITKQEGAYNLEGTIALAEECIAGRLIKGRSGNQR